MRYLHSTLLPWMEGPASLFPPLVRNDIAAIFERRGTWRSRLLPFLPTDVPSFSRIFLSYPQEIHERFLRSCPRRRLEVLTGCP